jgi:Mg/Co/Ni transporter MgtE
MPALRCWGHAVFYRPVFRRALQVSAVVGTTLFLINQLDVVLSGKVTALVIFKIALTYLVPFLVSTYSALEINRLRPALSAPSKAPPATPGAAA